MFLKDHMDGLCIKVKSKSRKLSWAVTALQVRDFGGLDKDRVPQSHHLPHGAELVFVVKSFCVHFKIFSYISGLYLLDSK